MIRYLILVLRCKYLRFGGLPLHIGCRSTLDTLRSSLLGLVIVENVVLALEFFRYLIPFLIYKYFRFGGRPSHFGCRSTLDTLRSSSVGLGIVEKIVLPVGIFQIPHSVADI